MRRSARSIAEIASLVEGRIVRAPEGEASEQPIRGLDSVRDATADQLTFISDERSAKAWPKSAAGAALVSQSIIDQGWISIDAVEAGRVLIVVADAEQSIIDLLECFAPPEPMPESGVHPSASIESDAIIGAGSRIGAHVSIGHRCTIGDGVILHPGVRIYDDVSIGDGTILHANCVVRERCSIGREVILHQGVLIGADGFGYRPTPDGRGIRKVPHIGSVTIEDAVEIGAGSCVDRAKFGTTHIGAGTKIDNLCQIAHNCRVGRMCVIAGCTGLAGSVEIGDGVQIGGGVCIAPHRTVGDGARIGAMSGIHTDVPAGASYIGLPGGEAGAVLRQYAALRRLPEWAKVIKSMANRSEA